MPKPAPTRPERVLFVHAHPDDETLVSGGTIATLLELGADVTVLTATRGERGEMLTPELAPLFGDGPRVAAHRETEIAASLAALGGPRHLWLGRPGARPTDLPVRDYTDSGMQWGANGRAVPADDAPADSLTMADFSEVVDDVRAAIRSTGADAVVSYADDGGYGHPDHVRIASAAKYAATAEDVPFSSIVDATSGDADVVVDILPVRGKHRAALESYRSQLTVDPADDVDPRALSYVMPHGARFEVPTHEGFRHAEPPVQQVAQSYAELTPQGRAAAVVVAGVLGLVVGGLGSVLHQQTIGSFPIGIVLMPLVVVGFLGGLRLLYRSRVLVTAGWLGIAVATLVLLQLVLANAAGYVWMIAPTAIAFVVLVWPDLQQARAAGARPDGARGPAAGAQPPRG